MNYVFIYILWQLLSLVLCANVKPSKPKSLPSDSIPCEKAPLTSESLQLILHQYAQVPVECIWRKRKEASRSQPFILFHQRKAGGSSLRQTINKATKNSYRRFIPEQNGLSGQTYQIPAGKKYSIYAGHFGWTTNVARLEGQVNERPNGPYCNRDTFSCLTNFREPIARIESCIYERYKEVFARYNGSCINDLPIKEFAEININFRRNDLFSCLNEPYRMFATDNETILNSMGFDYNNDTKIVTPRQTPQDLTALSLVLQRMAQCVPMVLEIPESRTMLKNAFPTLYNKNAFVSVVVNGQRHGIECPKVDGLHLEVLRNLSHFENIVYETVVSKVREAVQVIKV